jgi:hypothetical protein
VIGRWAAAVAALGHFRRARPKERQEHILEAQPHPGQDEGQTMKHGSSLKKDDSLKKDGKMLKISWS